MLLCILNEGMPASLNENRGGFPPPVAAEKHGITVLIADWPLRASTQACELAQERRYAVLE